MIAQEPQGRRDPDSVPWDVANQTGMLIAMTLENRREGEAKALTIVIVNTTNTRTVIKINTQKKTDGNTVVMASATVKNPIKRTGT